MPRPKSTPFTTAFEDYRRSRSEGSSEEALERLLRQCPDIELSQLVEVLLVEQALEWHYGPGPGVEEYLRRFPAVADQRQAVLELVYGEMRAMRALGQAMDADAYCARFPDLAEPLRRQLEVSAWLAGAKDDDSDVDSPGD